MSEDNGPKETHSKQREKAEASGNNSNKGSSPFRSLLSLVDTLNPKPTLELFELVSHEVKDTSLEVRDAATEVREATKQIKETVVNTVLIKYINYFAIGLGTLILLGNVLIVLGIVALLQTIL